MRKRKSTTSFSPRLFFGIIILILTCLVLLTTKPNGANKNHISTPTPPPPKTQQVIKLEIKNELDYTLPDGWHEEKQEKRAAEETLVIRTDDYQEEVRMKDGAIIRIRKGYSYGRSLPDLLIPWAKNPSGPGAPKPEDLSFTTINGHEAAYFPACWEGCNLEYQIVNGKKVSGVST